MPKQNLIASLAGTPTPWLCGAHSQDPIALGCRVALHRNLSGVPFPRRASAQQLRRLQLQIAEAVTGTELPHSGWHFDLTHLTSLDRHLLCERRISERNPAAPAEGCGIYLNAEQTRLVATNEHDHVSIQGLEAGANLAELYQAMVELDRYFARQLPYVWDPQLGYLTSSPGQVGTGLRAGVVLHLPGLLLAEQMDQVANAAEQMHMTIRSVFVNQDEACGNLFELTNRSSLGESAQSIIQRLCHITSDLIMQERRARQQVLHERPSWVYDYVSRGYALLRHAYRLDSSETANLLSAVRLGIDLEMLPGIDRHTIDHLTLLSQSAHLQTHMGRAMEQEERSEARAELVRSLLTNAGQL